MKNIRFNKVLLIGLFLLTFGCTNLEEEILDESLTGSGAQAEVISGSIAPVYGMLRQVWMHTVNFGLQEIASDEAILPFRGGTDWYDGGKYIEVYQHLMTPANALVGDAWTNIGLALSRAVIAEEKLKAEVDKGNKDAQGPLYEMIAINSYLNMLALDNWGVIFKKEQKDALSEILRGQDAVTYLEGRLLSCLPVLTNTDNPGRITKDAVNGFLARLYMNAAVYRDPYGTPNFKKEDMDKVIQYTSSIISGAHALSPEYFDLFSDANHTNTELIFALDQRGVLETDQSRWAYWPISGAQVPRPEQPSTRGTDAAAATPDFIKTWTDHYGSVDPADADARFYMKKTIVPDELQDLTGVNPSNDADHYYCVPATSFEIDRGILRGVIWGPRKDKSGNIIKCGDGTVRIYPVIKQNDKDANTVYVNHTPDVNFTSDGSLHNTGYRFSKYQFSHTNTNCCSYSSVDIVLVRLGEMYLMRAEAKLRNGDNAGALDDINTLRTSRNARPDQTPAALTSIDIDGMYREAGFELYWEGLKRTYQIRFGKYEAAYTEKTDNDPHKRLFPIPQKAMDAASGNYGFLVQNPGY